MATGAALRLFGSPVAWESAVADSFLLLGVLTPSPQYWTLRSTNSPGSVLGVEDDLRTPQAELMVEIASVPAPSNTIRP
jgi:hypothetical protein